MENLALNDFCAYISDWRRSKEFYTPPHLNGTMERDLMLGKLMLVVTEVAEMAEAVRHENFRNFAEELADTCIRLFDIAATTGIDLEKEIKAKMVVNEGRPPGHGKKCSL